jgi:hypothetical protein
MGNITSERQYMIRAIGLPLVLLALLSACSKSPIPLSPAEEPPKRSAEALATEWAFNPGKDHKLQGYGWFKTKSGENLVVASGRLQDTGKAREWMARVSAFYTEKCGSDKDPVKLHSQTGKHEVGINGEDKNKGRYLIDEPGIMLIPLALIPPRPNELVFAYHDDNSTVTAVVWQQGDDVVLISVTATVR